MEETLLNQNQFNENEETLVNVENQVEGKTEVGTSEKKNKFEWKQVTMGGATGILFGMLGTVLTGSASVEDPETKTDSKPDPTPVPNTNVTVDDLPVANSVNDDMSFNEAFAAARAEVGAGGIFVWHGGVYGTYYANEWNQMTEEERNEFGAKVHYGASSSANHQDTPSNNGGGSATHTDEPHTDETHNDKPIKDEPTKQDEQGPDEEGELHILGIEEQEGMTVVNAVADGNAMAIIDVDQDGMMDFVVVDNGNGVLDDNDLIQDIQGTGLSLDQIQNQMDVQNQMAEGPDYVNDANIDTFEA